MFKIRYGFLLALIAICPSIVRADAPTQSANLPVSRVTLYTSGVGYFERNGTVDGDATQTLSFPVDEINDILKSLVLLDKGGGTIEPVTYAAQDPVEKQLQAFSIDLSDNPSRATLLNRLRGAAATITTSGSTLTGTIVGVETATVTLPNDGGTTTEDTLNLLAGDGLHAVKLADVTAITLTDPTLNQEMREALAVVANGRDASMRPVKLTFDGSGRRDVVVGYLAETPLWQTTYRLVLGSHPLLQGWALVQNTSQDDWDGVTLSLVSGRPISFTQDLYTPIYVPRPVVQAQVAASPTPQSYNSNLQANDESETTPEPMPEPPAASPPSGLPEGVGHIYALQGDNSIVASKAMGGFAAGGAVPSTLDANAALRNVMSSSGAKLGTALFSYDIKVPVTVPRRQSAMIPFISSDIAAEPVSIYNQSVQSDHPLSGARLKNTSGLHLMGGPVTVFDSGAEGTAYVGDALIDDTEPGQTRLLSYAIDLAVDAEVSNGGGATQTESIVISKGVLVATTDNESITTYHFKNHGDKPRTIVVENPYPGDGWKLIEPAKADEHTADYDRFDLNVPAGASKSLAVKEEEPTSTTYALLDCDFGTIAAFSSSGEASEAVKAALHEVVARRNKVADLQAAIDNRNAQLDAISSGQERIRDNMKALDHASALYKRYVGELNDQETQIDSLRTAVNSLTGQRDAAQADLEEYLGSLNID